MKNPIKATDQNLTVPSSERHVPEKLDLRQQKEREKMAQRRDRRATYDLPPTLRDDLQTLSGELRIPASQLVSLALFRFLKEFRAGEVDLRPYKKPSRSPRYDWNLELPEALVKTKKSSRSYK